MSKNQKKLFCIECGKSLEKDEIINGLCIDCYRKFYSLFDVKDTDIDICRRCFSFRHRNKWITVKTSDLTEVVQQILKVKSSFLTEKHGKVEISFENIEFERKSVEDTITAVVRVVGIGKPIPKVPVYKEVKNLKLNLHFTLCQKCAQFTREYFEAIIQLRGEPEHVDEALNITLNIIDNIFNKRKMDEKAFVTKIKKTRGGIDIYFGSNRIARMVAYQLRDELGAKIIETRKIVSKDRQTSKNVYKQTFSVRLLPFKKGDILEINETAFLVLDDIPSRGKLRSFNIISGKEENIPVKNLWKEDIKILARENIEKFMVASVSKNYVTLMNLRDYSPLEISKDDIPFKISEGEEVEAIKIKGKLYLLPKVMKKK